MAIFEIKDPEIFSSIFWNQIIIVNLKHEIFILGPKLGMGRISSDREFRFSEANNKQFR